MEKYFDIKDDSNNNVIKCKLYYSKAKYTNNDQEAGSVIDIVNSKDINSVIISCHGYGGSRVNGSTGMIAEALLEKHADIAMLTFDWPCHGDDTRQKLKLTDCNDYLDCVIRYVKDIFKADYIYSQATSFGGYLTLKYISEHGNPFRKTALRCPAVNMYGVLTDRLLAKEDYESIMCGKCVLTGYDRKIPIDKAAIDELIENDISQRNFTDVSEDILIMNGTNDELVSYEYVKEFAKKNGIRFETIEGADHRYSDTDKMNECIAFMEELYFGD